LPETTAVEADSILNKTKKAIGIGADYTPFDVDIIMHINSVFAVLTQLGVGPVGGFEIEDDTPTWETYTGGDKELNMVKSLMYARVRLLFDPPTTGYGLEHLKKVADEYEWRLMTVIEARIAIALQTSSAEVWIIDENEELPSDMNVGDVGYDPATGNLWKKT
jgi:hypothetical protein